MNEITLDKATNDDEFFETLESTRTNLNHIFDGVPKPRIGNPTLKYQPPKQAVVNPQSDSTLPWSSQLAKVVTAFKDSVAIGKVGVALLRNTNDEYKIIVYKSKTNVLGTCTLQFDSATATAVYRQHPYIQFYDGAQSYWSLLFDKEDDETEFVKILQTIAVKIIELERKAEHVIEKKLPSPPPKLKAPKSYDDEVSTDKSKISLLSRMAKMGQKLPKYTVDSAVNDASDDSTDIEEVFTPMVLNSKKPILAPRNRSNSQVPNAVGVYSSCSLPQVQLHETHFMQMMLTENRTQNSEMRMNFNKLESKIEKVLDKIDAARGSATKESGPHKEEEIIQLEEKLLMLKKENRKLKQSLEVAQKSQQNFDTFTAEFSEPIRELELKPCDDWKSLGKELVLTSTTLQTQLKQMQVMYEALAQQLNDTNKELTEQNKLLEVKHGKFEALKDEWKQAEANIDKQRRIIHDLKEELHQQSLQSAEQQKKARTETHRAVKEIMNSLYSSLASQLDSLPGDNVSKEDILSIVGKVIKYETMQAMQNIQK